MIVGIGAAGIAAAGRGILAIFGIGDTFVGTGETAAGLVIP